jgi:glycosyltransferase involved in cell wall biosynthesis
VRPGYLRFADLPGYLGGATVVAFPSHGEGFGLPVLEAMACGAAVLTTHRLSLPEVGGDAVAYTEPSSEDIAAALTALLDDGARRAALGQAALTRAREFTWAASAEAHLASYQRAVQQG